MYVAITRARQRLYLTFSQTRLLHGQTRYNVRSRWFDELPEEALKWLTPRTAGFGSGYAKAYQDAWSRGSGLGSMVGAGRVEGGRSGDLGSRSGSALTSPGSALRNSNGPAGTDGRPLRVGQGVFHNKFGEGVIVTLEGSGTDARAQVSFGRHGMKWLALSVAKLTPVD